MSEIKAIETRYKGYRFRSRLEARWAVFFDALGVKWEYEPEGFELKNGRYLPDFRIIADSQLWVEIKPNFPSGDEFQKLYDTVIGTNTGGLFVCGTPGEEDIYDIPIPLDAIDPPGYIKCLLEIVIQRKLAEAEYVLRKSASVTDLIITEDDYDVARRVFWERFISRWIGCDLDMKAIFQIRAKAVHAARSARFEHGEQG
jgi:hypothetical protein